MVLLGNIIKHVLMSLYAYFFSSIIMTVLCMFAYTSLKKIGVKKTIIEWINNFKSDREFRITALLAFYVFLLLFRTVLARSYWGFPVKNVIGVWGIYDDKGELYTEGIENIVLFIPLALLYLEWKALTNKENHEISFLQAVYIAGYRSLLLSLIIEFGQLFFKLGMFQLSDICFNMFGGIIGGILYFIINRLKKNRRKKQ